MGSGARQPFKRAQARVTDEDLVVEIPRYTINHAREH